MSIRFRNGRINKTVTGKKNGVIAGGWYTTKKLNTHVCRQWRGIMSSEYTIKENGTMVVRDGKRISFYNDVWCVTKPLSRRFPSLHAFIFFAPG